MENREGHRKLYRETFCDFWGVRWDMKEMKKEGRKNFWYSVNRAHIRFWELVQIYRNVNTPPCLLLTALVRYSTIYHTKIWDCKVWPYAAEAGLEADPYCQAAADHWISQFWFDSDISCSSRCRIFRYSHENDYKYPLGVYVKISLKIPLGGIYIYIILRSYTHYII